ncbi:MAG: 3-methyl-2-oxobutanoate hydroxymethyltransferase [bacterium]|nr:3-methyl-2-oxobutanoate hydroxymethyltransferase [bacterium]
MSIFERLSVPGFVAMKQQRKKICMLTAYDYTFASLLDDAGVDAILVGDTVSVVVQGNDTTLPVTLDEMIYHTRLVGRGVKRALVIGDMPFASYNAGVSQAIQSASRFLKETSCQAVKLEGGQEQSNVIRALVDAGIPVMAHVGVRPQNVHAMGGYKVQRDQDRLLGDARAAQEAGAFAIVLECIPTELANQITASLEIPTIGIGAGAGCDGQVLVVHDMLGLIDNPPRFVKPYANLKQAIGDAATEYCGEVRNGAFPAKEHSYK